MRRPLVRFLRVNSCAHLFVPDPPPSCPTACTRICAYNKDPISICRKTEGLTAGGIVTQKKYTAYTRLVSNQGWVSATLSQAAFLGKSDPNVLRGKFPLGQESRYSTNSTDRLTDGTALLLTGHGHGAVGTQHAATRLARSVTPRLARLQNHETRRFICHAT